MIDYFALSLGHGLLAIALWRLVLRDALDVDPLIDRFREAARDRARARSNSGRRASARGGLKNSERAGAGPDAGPLEER